MEKEYFGEFSNNYDFENDVFELEYTSHDDSLITKLIITQDDTLIIEKGKIDYGEINILVN